MTARRSRRPAVVLFLLCLGLGYVVYTELQSGPVELGAMAVPAERPEPAPAPSPEPAFTLPPLADFAETLERPLFLPSRRPLAPDEEAPNQTATVPGRNLFTLMGVIISPDERMAIMKRRKGGEILRVVEGQWTDGWLVEAILPDRIALRHGEETEEVEIKDISPPERRRERPDKRRRRPREQPPAGEREPAQEPAQEPAAEPDSGS
jgi:hypothetical protein